MKRLLWLLQWLLKAAVFFTLFAFALNNQQDTRVHFFFGTYWQAPTVLVVLAAFALGVAAGVLGMAGLSPTMVPPASVDLGKVDEALAVIAGQGVPARRQFVRAIGAAMLHDGRAEPAEVEIVRAVADSLGISFATGLSR